MSTGRMEAFSDGVIAVAITLLVLDIKVPPPDSTHNLAHELLIRWPTYAAYVTSFLTIGIIWINHHVMISRLRQADHAILILNLLLLMSIGVLPFATSLMSAYLKHPAGQHVAAGVYAGSLLVMAILFAALNRHILIAKHHYLSVPLPEPERRRILARSVIGVAPYAIATAVAALSSYVTLALCAALAVYYALPLASGAAHDESA